MSPISGVGAAGWADVAGVGVDRRDVPTLEPVHQRVQLPGVGHGLALVRRDDALDYEIPGHVKIVIMNGLAYGIPVAPEQPDGKIRRDRDTLFVRKELLPVARQPGTGKNRKKITIHILRPGLQFFIPKSCDPGRIVPGGRHDLRSIGDLRYVGT